MDIGIYMTFVVQATTVLAEKTSLEDKLSKKPDYFIRDKIANFIYWFWGHDSFRGQKGLTFEPVVDCSKTVQQSFSAIKSSQKCWQ